MLKERPAGRLDDCGMLPDHVGDRVGGGVLSRSRHEVRCLRALVDTPNGFRSWCVGSQSWQFRRHALSGVLVAVCHDLKSHPVRAASSRTLMQFV